MAGYKPGDFVDGYEFVGGDVKDRNNWQDWGDGAKMLPDGSIVRYGPRGGMTTLRGATKATAAPPDIKEFQAKAAAQATLMDQALTDYNDARQTGYNPASGRNALALATEKVPLAGPFFADMIRDNPSERGRAAELAYTEGSLRALTGAAATEGETRRNARNMFRQPGESEAVEPNKAAVRERFASSAKRIAGPAYMPPEQSARGGGRGQVPQAARSAYQARLGAGKVDQKAPRGTEWNPFLARDQQTLDRLPPGSYVIAPDGSFGIIE